MRAISSRSFKKYFINKENIMVVIKEKRRQLCKRAQQRPLISKIRYLSIQIVLNKLKNTRGKNAWT